MLPPRDFPEEGYYKWPDYDEEVGIYDDLDDGTDFENLDDFDWDEFNELEIEWEWEQ